MHQSEKAILSRQSSSVAFSDCTIVPYAAAQSRPVFDNKANPVIGSRDQRGLWPAQAQDAVYRRRLGSSAYLNGRGASAVQPRAVGGIDDDRAQPVAMRIPSHRKAGNRSAENHQGGQCDSGSAPLGVLVAIKLRELRLAVGAGRTTITVQSTLTCKTRIDFCGSLPLSCSSALAATPARSEERVRFLTNATADRESDTGGCHA